MAVVKINDKCIGYCMPLAIVCLGLLYTFGLYTFGFVYLWVIILLYT